ncbi:inorganic phosphate transporter [Sphingomonas sp.]|uniref:inorganic phosphate transporter n=1 Tax=Sphingomonas sp. TaxID=28214 RepID=UPI001D8B8DC5|nr:inorganic phosphate transporter [Sphingomonas sp.]MBX9795582.1 inorganic phosphate transporter [Sphingomonas sp.]
MSFSSTAAAKAAAPPPRGPQLDRPVPGLARWLFLGTLVGGFAYALLSVLGDTQSVGEQMGGAVIAFLVVALLIALGFEFVNGFHDTANAVATVIYTHAMPAPLAVFWSGLFNFLGVMFSSGAVAYSIITLLPVELILNVGSNAGFAMIFALLLAAVLWNVATWYVGLPNSSSHALIGSILGVGFANQIIAGGTSGTSGVDWSQAQKVLSALLVSPMIGFFGAILLLLAMRALLRNPALYRAPEGEAPPPTGIRALLIFTCTAVSFTHGSNDGQKGMGLIMLILIGCAPTAYALNRTLDDAQTPKLVAQAEAAAGAFAAHGGDVRLPLASARDQLASALKTKSAEGAEIQAALATVSRETARALRTAGTMAKLSPGTIQSVRTDMYLALDASKLALKAPNAKFTETEKTAITDYQHGLEGATRYIPMWVKVAVAIALGLGTMVGWKRIVVTVGERIGKSHLTYGMGAVAELVTAMTITLAERFGLPVSTTHILSSGVAGASVANGAGLQARTIRNMVLAWVMTLPATIALSGGLYWLFLTVARAIGTA